MRHYTILLADDDPAMRAWLRAVLGGEGLELREAATGCEALELLADDPSVDLIISDVRMPAPSGLQVLATARAAGVEAPFLLITAFGEDDLRQAARALDARVLDKPFTANELRVCIDSLLAGKT